MAETQTTVLPPDRVVTTVVAIQGPPTSTIQAGQGPAGPPGSTGPVGPVGPPGATTGDLNYAHDQMVPSATWTVVHSLGKMPSVAVIDSSGAEVEGEIQYLTPNSLRLVFSAAFSGKAYFN